MKTNGELAIKQIEIQEKIQSAGFNVVNCGNCGNILLHEIKDITIECFCGITMNLSDCPDLWYRGREKNIED